ncbi:SAC3 family protein C isoform X3 [Herrania umbratica]|uniref:SAC3 family protein C isoform X3 n=1 Tax=Herrania umbratica TaxID=108875 RepID=A0A6J1BA87_9ROSI|nr:SAC3 family protein C isoform X3 [Herrania umbratica]
MDESGRRRQQWRNHPSSSASASPSTGPTRFRSQQYSSNPTKTTQSSNFVPRSTTTTGTTPHNTRNPGYVPRWKSVSNANNQQEGETEAGEEVGSIVGTCPFMCPEGERAQRERLRDLAIFERLNGDPRKTSPALAVKKVKFHIVSHHRLQNCGSSSISSLQYLNMEQLMKTLASLYTLYEANHSSNSIYENEAEFRSFHVLLHLDSKSQQREESLSFWFRRVPSLVMKSNEMHFARQVLRFYRMGIYRSFLCTVSAEASYLQYCIIEPYVNEVRALAVSYINNCCYKLHPYPLEDLSKLLMMKESDMESFCHACGLKTLSDDGGNKLLPTKQTTFCNPKGSFQSYSILGLQQYERSIYSSGNCRQTTA